MNQKQLAQFIDHTALTANKTISDIEQLCFEAHEYGFFSVCLNPYFIEHAQRFLAHSDVKICTVIDFPLGASDEKSKAIMTRQALNLGAQEIDMVIPIGALKSGRKQVLLNHIQAVVNESKTYDDSIVSKVIIETALLTEDEKKLCCEMVSEAGASFIKTSTGFSTSGAQIKDIELFKKHLDPSVKIKASGGIGNYEKAMQFINAGVHRIGASKSIEIVTGAPE